MRALRLVPLFALTAFLGCGSSDDSAAPAGSGTAAGGANAGTGGSSSGAGGTGGTHASGAGGSAAGSSGKAGAGGSAAGGTSGGGTSTGGTNGGGTNTGGTSSGGTNSGGTNTGGTSTTGGTNTGGTSATAGTNTGGTSTTGGTNTGGTDGAGGSGLGGTMSTGGTDAGGSGGSAGGGDSVTIAQWTDAPGACPSGATQKDISTLSDLEDATRGENAFSNDAPDTCYLIHDGTYVQAGSTLPMLIEVGGTDATHRRIFVGESRSGVIVNGRVTIDSNVSHVQLSNLTYDLTGYSQSGSFNTLTLLDGSVDLRIDHIDFKGDCMTGANGGHVEISGSSDVIVEACLIEKFGRCGTMPGHQDHGVYLASGTELVIRNNEIRGNSSRGVLLNTENGDYGQLDTITIENNSIHDNGHADYEDGIAMNATGTGNISNVTVQNNLLYTNYYSGVRVVGTVYQGINVQKNTFFHNGDASSGMYRSDANIDSSGSGANTVYSKNIFVSDTAVLYSCFDATPRGFLLTDNVTMGMIPSGADGACVTQSLMIDPMLANPAGFDFHAQNPAADGYGAYTP